MNDEGSIHVVEAVLAGIIMLSAVLFMSAVTAPSPALSETGVNLEDVAADTLQVLRTRPAEDDVTYDNRLEEIVDLAMQGDTADAQSFIASIIPTGNRYLLRLDNGVEEIPLVPQGSGVATTPRAARAAETFLVPDWQFILDDPATFPCATTSGPYEVGKANGPDVASGAVLTGPNGATAPGGVSWKTWWLANDDPSITPNQVPSSAPYGQWDLDGDCFYLIPPGGSASDYPIYGIQLVVWPIA